MTIQHLNHKSVYLQMKDLVVHLDSKWSKMSWVYFFQRWKAGWWKKITSSIFIEGYLEFLFAKM